MNQPWWLSGLEHASISSRCSLEGPGSNPAQGIYRQSSVKKPHLKKLQVNNLHLSSEIPLLWSWLHSYQNSLRVPFWLVTEVLITGKNTAWGWQIKKLRIQLFLEIERSIDTNSKNQKIENSTFSRSYHLGIIETSLNGNGTRTVYI